MAFSGAAHTPLAAPENESEPPLEIIFLGAAHLLQYRSLFVETGDFLVRHKKNQDVATNHFCSSGTNHMAARRKLREHQRRT